MKKLVILNSMTNNARAYANQEFAYFDFFDSVQAARDAIAPQSFEDRPWLAVVDASNDFDFSIGAEAAAWGYMVETRGVP